MGARPEFAADVAQAAFDRARRGLRAFMSAHSFVDASTQAAVLDLLVLSPVGLHSHNPCSEVYRARLTALATAAARLLTPVSGLTPP